MVISISDKSVVGTASFIQKDYIMHMLPSFNILVCPYMYFASAEATFDRSAEEWRGHNNGRGRFVVISTTVCHARAECTRQWSFPITEQKSEI